MNYLSLYMVPLSKCSRAARQKDWYRTGNPQWYIYLVWPPKRRFIVGVLNVVMNRVNPPNSPIGNGINLGVLDFLRAMNKSSRNRSLSRTNWRRLPAPNDQKRRPERKNRDLQHKLSLPEMIYHQPDLINQAQVYHSLPRTRKQEEKAQPRSNCARSYSLYQRWVKNLHQLDIVYKGCQRRDSTPLSSKTFSKKRYCARQSKADNIQKYPPVNGKQSNYRAKQKPNPISPLLLAAFINSRTTPILLCFSKIMACMEDDN